MDNLPELTKLFRSAWARNDEAPESAMLHECTENHKGVRALLRSFRFGLPPCPF